MRWICGINKMRNTYKVWDGKYEGIRPAEQPQHTWEDTICIVKKENGVLRRALDSFGYGYRSVTDSCEYSN
jgi:hypothetical protein